MRLAEVGGRNHSPARTGFRRLESRRSNLDLLLPELLDLQAQQQDSEGSHPSPHGT